MPPTHFTATGCFQQDAIALLIESCIIYMFQMKTWLIQEARSPHVDNCRLDTTVCEMLWAELPRSGRSARSKTDWARRCMTKPRRS